MLGRLGLLQYMLTKGKGIGTPDNMEIMSVLMGGFLTELIFSFVLNLDRAKGIPQHNQCLMAAVACELPFGLKRQHSVEYWI
ncbi:hypothetical protein F8388_014756 [Cannabis sativa]|uniref:Uncharacterized protein n=1 Tax=Cannabis sativa TaxID=3483 RepID=A0A7J6GYT4_CANSA|nr:hypothetical protein F8388_014756 [Cannabis sativa]